MVSGWQPGTARAQPPPWCWEERVVLCFPFPRRHLPLFPQGFPKQKGCFPCPASSEKRVYRRPDSAVSHDHVPSHCDFPNLKLRCSQQSF